MNKNDLKIFLKSLRKLVRILIYQFKVNEFLGTSVAQRHVLIFVGDYKKTNIQEISNGLSMNKGNVSKTIQQLVQLGFVTRKISDEDRRYTIITLTKQGKAIYRKIINTVDPYFNYVFSLIPKDKHRDVVECFDLFISAVIKSNKVKCE